MSVQQVLKSSIGRKMIMAATGLIMFFLFLLPHLGGNILFLFGPDLFNSYAMHLHELKALLIVIQLIMIVSILVHMITGMSLVIGNKLGSGKRETWKSTPKRSLTARLMPVSGTMIFLFIIKHLLDFQRYEKTTTVIDGHTTYDVYAMVLERFQDPVHVALYVMFMIAVGLHLSHGLQSTLQTFGFYVPREGSLIKRVSVLVAIVVAGTFAIIPVVAYLR